MSDSVAPVTSPQHEPAHIRQRGDAAVGAAHRQLNLLARALGYQWGYSWLAEGHHLAMAAAVTGVPAVQVEGTGELEVLDGLLTKLQAIVEYEADEAVRA